MIVGVRVARRLGVTLWVSVLVALGIGLLVMVGLYSSGVAVWSGVEDGARVGVAEAGSGAMSTEVCVGAGVGDSPAWWVRAMTVGM